MLDPDDPRQMRKYKQSGITFVISVIILLLFLAYLAVYIHFNKPL